VLPDELTRREFSTRLASLLAFTSVTGRGIPGGRLRLAGELIRTDAIHQEVTLNANRHRVYEALTDGKQFSALMAYSTVPKAPPAQIAPDVGGTFSIFGGHIVGRHLELVPDQRIVQAWRVVDWAPGIFSIARFQLKDKGSGTTIVFDHIGFPNGQAKHLASGWHLNYWEPLKKYLV
jgi:activator of HSP90 ATPase